MLLLTMLSCKQNHYDVVIVGGTPGGIMTAISAARMGQTALLLERTSHIGGLPANGLGATDIATRGATTGLFLEFVNNIKQKYTEKYGADSQQLRDCSDGYHFEPSMAQEVFDEMIAACGRRIKVRTMRQFDALAENVTKTGQQIVSIRVLDRKDGTMEEYFGKVFIDATYEGDLGAAAGVPFRTRREGRSEHNEPVGGRMYQFWRGPIEECSTFEGDNTIQAYNYRLCLTSDKDNQIAFRKPETYNREEYLSLVDDVLYGYNTNPNSQFVTNAERKANMEAILAGGKTQIDGDPWGVDKLTNMVRLPNGKNDANNQHLAFISTDLPEENWEWPTASWEWRDAFAKRLRDYTEGLFWFASHDEALPKSFREAVMQWGYAADEYTDNDNFPRQVYVREGRRFEGMYFFTANDAIIDPSTGKAPLHKNSITASHYNLDSHAHHKREPYRVHLDGFLTYDTPVYNVPYGVIVPKEVTNLLLPVPVSGTHIGFSTLRMEPCWMALGQAAGVAATLSIRNQTTVQDVDISTLQDELLKQKVTLVYMPGHSPEDTNFITLQKEALK